MDRLMAGWRSATAKCIVLALVVAYCPGTAIADPPAITGNWAGVFENSENKSGVDNLEITLHRDRTVTGTWDGKKIENGAVVTDKLLQWEGVKGRSRYSARCQIQGGGKVLVIEYTVTTRDAEGKLVGGYTGTSRLTKK